MKVWKQSCALDNSMVHKVFDLSQKTWQEVRAYFHPWSIDLDLQKIVYGLGFEVSGVTEYLQKKNQKTFKKELDLLQGSEWQFNILCKIICNKKIYSILQ